MKKNLIAYPHRATGLTKSDLKVQDVFERKYTGLLKEFFLFCVADSAGAEFLFMTALLGFKKQPNRARMDYICQVLSNGVLNLTDNEANDAINAAAIIRNLANSNANNTHVGAPYDLFDKLHGPIRKNLTDNFGRFKLNCMKMGVFCWTYQLFDSCTFTNGMKPKASTKEQNDARAAISAMANLYFDLPDFLLKY